MAFVALFVFTLLYLSPGNPAAIIGGDLATAADIHRIRIALGLDRPFFWRFGIWLWGVLHGDLGKSIFTGEPVLLLVWQRVGPTLSLTICTLLITVAVSVPMGVIAAWKAGSLIDRLVMAFAVIGFSVPVFVLAYLLILVFSMSFHLLPVQGYESISNGFWPFLSHMILPSVALAITFTALIARIARASMVEVLSQDYIRTAKAKGLGESEVLLTHALKNAAVPIVTIIGIGIAVLLSGVVVTEEVFAIPGVGSLVVDAILSRDYPIIQGMTLLFSVVYVVINLLIDISYVFFDPRIRY